MSRTPDHEVSNQPEKGTFNFFLVLISQTSSLENRVRGQSDQGSDRVFGFLG